MKGEFKTERFMVYGYNRKGQYKALCIHEATSPDAATKWALNTFGSEYVDKVEQLTFRVKNIER